MYRMEHRLSRWATVLSGAVIAAGVVAPAAAERRAFNHDDWVEAVRRRALDPAEVVYPLASSAEMAAWAAERLAGHPGLGPVGQLGALQEELFRDEAFEFSYDDGFTLTAREAFDLRRGDCMSFTALFIALSRSVGIPTFLVSVRRAPEIERTEGLVVVNRHVVAGYRSANEVVLFDFSTSSSAPYVQHVVVDDVMASAMYHTNLGGSAIRSGALDEALRHLGIATRLEPGWAASWVNLGVARFRGGDVDGAMEAYRTALEVDPGNSSALNNLSFAYRELGMEAEARAALAAAVRTTDNPFTLIAMADVEMERGRLDRAARHLRRARWGYGDEPAVHDALARLARREGRLDRAEKHSARAAELRRDEREADDARPATSDPARSGGDGPRGP